MEERHDGPSYLGHLWSSNDELSMQWEAQAEYCDQTVTG